MSIVTKESNPKLYNALFEEEKSAKEMFEKLGYKLSAEDDLQIRYIKKHFISDTNYILFNKKDKIINNFIASDSPFTPPQDLPLNMQELQAINKQISELGWLDD